MKDSLQRMQDRGEAIWENGEQRKSSNYENYEIQYRLELHYLHNLKKKFEDLNQLSTEEIPGSYIVSKASPASKPAHPKKLFLTLVAAVLSSLLGLLFLRFKETSEI